MKKTVIRTITIFLILACILGCIVYKKAREIQNVGYAIPDAPSATIPSLVYEGNLYRTTGKQIPVEVDETAIVGRVSSVVPLGQLPTKEGEANFGEIGDSYVITSDGLLVIMNNEWTLFEQYETENKEATEENSKDLHKKILLI